MSDVTTLSVEPAAYPHGDALAQAVIAGYWHDFLHGDSWSYHRAWPRHVPGDRWADRDRWIEMARRCLDEDRYQLTAYEILLAEGLTEYAPAAFARVQEWHTMSGHDPHYYYDILAHLPDSDVRRSWLEVDPDELWHDRDGVRRALLSVADPRACEIVAGRIVRELAEPAPEVSFADSLVPSRLMDLGPLCQSYVPGATMARAKELCLEELARDRAYVLGRDPTREEGDDGMRSLWIRDEVAGLASRVGWKDVLQMLAGEAWYWSSVFEDDRENRTLLCWSLCASTEALEGRAMEVMRSRADFRGRIDGAIAWVRLHAAAGPIDPVVR